MKKVFFLLIACFPHFGWTQQYSVLVLSDIHLSLTMDADAQKNSDADTALFKSALQEANGKYKYILLPGDLMQHGQVHDEISLRNTFTYIIDHVHNIDHNAIIIPALGNNDCLQHNSPDTGTYRIFYECLLKRLDKDKTIWDDGCSYGGYYELAAGKLSFISLNTVLFERKSDANIEELNWLEQHLKQDSAKNQQVWIMYHIPPGIGQGTKNRWDSDLEGRYVQLMRRFAAIVCYQQAGHTHTDDDKLITQYGKLISYIHISPGLNYRNGNNPAFQALEVNKGLNTVNNIITHYTDIGTYNWKTYSFNNFTFNFLLNYNPNSEEGKIFMKHYTTMRDSHNEWNETFARRSVIGEE